MKWDGKGKVDDKENAELDIIFGRFLSSSTVSRVTPYSFRLVEDVTRWAPNRGADETGKERGGYGSRVRRVARLAREPGEPPKDC